MGSAQSEYVAVTWARHDIDLGTSLTHMTNQTIFTWQTFKICMNQLFKLIDNYKIILIDNITSMLRSTIQNDSIITKQSFIGSKF